MSFPVSYSGYPTGPVPNPFMSVDMSGVPGAFGGQPPMAMGVPGLFPGMNSMGMGGMGLDPFSAGMPPMGIDPMTGMPLGGGMPMGIDPMTGMPLGGGMPMGIDPMTGMPLGGGMPPMGIDPMTGMPLMAGSTGMPIGLDPFGGMQGGGFAPPGVMPPPMGMDPFGGMAMGGNPMGGPMPSGGGFYPPAQPQQQPPQNPIKQMFMMLIQMKLFQQFLNPGGNELPVDPAAGDPATDGSGDTGGEVADNATALDIIADSKNFKAIGGADGNISFLDLSRAARTSKNADVKAAAEYITKENPGLFKQLEKLTRPGDGVFTEDDLGKALQTTSIVQGDASTDSVGGGHGNDTLTGGDGNDSGDEKITDNLSALDSFAAHFDDLDENSDGKVTETELSSAASNSDDPQLKKLAKYLRTKGLFTDVDELDEKDGVTIKDINDAMKDPDITQVDSGTPAAAIDVTGVTDEQAVKTINQNFSVIDALKDPKKKDRAGLSDGKLSVEDLDAIINSKSRTVTDEMKKAAQVMKNDSLIAKLDKSEKDDTNTQNVDESKDNFIGKDTLQKWSDNYQDQQTTLDAPKDLKSAMVIINRAGAGTLFGDSSKKKFTIDDVRTAINKDGQAADVKGALQYLVDHPDEFKKLDKLDQSDDGNIQWDVVPDAAASGADLKYFDKDPTVELNRQALTVLDDIFDQVDTAAEGGDKDKVISQDDMKAALADRTGKYTAKQKSALAYLLNKKQSGGYTLWDSIDGGDGKIGKDKFERELLNASDDDLKPENLNKDNKLDGKA